MTMIRRYVATFIPQAWVNGYTMAVDAPGDARWDATDFIRKYYATGNRDARSSLRAALNDTARGVLDSLQTDPRAPHWIAGWSGPFDVEVRIERVPLNDVIAARLSVQDERGLTPDQMAERYGGSWGEHPEHTVSDWQYEVANDDTRRGYWAWVCANVDADAPSVAASTPDPAITLGPRL